MNSCLYTCTVMHHRLVPKKNKFSYEVFLFYVDLDELEQLSKKFFLFGWNRFSLFSFHDKNHAQTVYGKEDRAAPVKRKLLEFLKQQGEQRIPHKIRILTNLTTAGYLFNPVSFYYLFDEGDRPYAAVAEVCNTFGEMKLYLLKEDTLVGDTFSLMVPKDFYVSPFSRANTWFHFILKVPAEKLLQRVDDYTSPHGDRFLLSSMAGERKEISDGMLLKQFLRIPLVTVKIIVLIHWQAFRIYLKGIPYFKKKEDQEFQQHYVKL